MYKLYTTFNGITFTSKEFRTLWAANYIAAEISFGGTAVDIIDEETGEVMLTYTDRGTRSYVAPGFYDIVKAEAIKETVV